MSLTAQTWRYVGVATPAAATVAGCLDALYTLGTSATYHDATSRTEGAGMAWTWTGKRYQSGGATECLYPQPPTDTLTQRVLFAGSAGAKTPTMWIDTWAAATVMCGIVKNAGAYNAWDNAAPMTSGQFSGYAKSLTTSNCAKVHLYECQEAILVVWERSDGGCHISYVGAILDPESPDVTTDAESDGKLYGLYSTGSSAAQSATMWASAAQSEWMWHSGTNAQSHCGVFTPGGSTMLTLKNMHAVAAAMTATGMKTRSGRYAYAPTLCRYSAAAPNDQFAGRVREVFMFADGLYATKLTSGGTTYGYVVGANNATPYDALFLKH